MKKLPTDRRVLILDTAVEDDEANGIIGQSRGEIEKEAKYASLHGPRRLASGKKGEAAAVKKVKS